MSATPSVAPITDGDDVIRAALDGAMLPALLPALAHATGDLSLLRDDLRPDPLRMAEPDAGLSVEQAATIKDLAFDAIRRFRDGGCVAAPTPSHEVLHRFMEHTVGGPVSTDYLPLLEEELSITGEDLRAPGWRLDEVAPGRDFRVVIIGAGMSGLLVAYRLQQAGVPFTILEKHDDVGGTWWANTYPGCRVDNPNHIYSYSFAQRHEWPFHNSPQPVLLEYFRSFVREHDLAGHIRFGTWVRSIVWDDERTGWTIRATTPDGDEDVLEADAVISAVGQLNVPRMPDIPGVERFAGPAFHSATWDHDVVLEGKRVAVIGTGASACQLIPPVAERAGHLTVFQRNAPWLVFNAHYTEPVGAGLRWLYRHVPFYSEWHRFWMFWRTGDGMLDLARVDPDWPPTETSVSAANELMRQLLTGYLEIAFADRPDLLATMTPTYPPVAKRVVVDNGILPRALMRDDVDVVTTPIREITERGVVTEDGIEHAVDVLVYGTGFQASNFLGTLQVKGRHGTDLHEQWAGDARAYLGVTIPDFPNLFCCYGPNTNIVINASTIYFVECEVRYILGCLEMLLARGARAIDVDRRVHDEFNARVDAQNRMMAWGFSKVTSWYKNEFGRVAQNWPFSLLEFWQLTRQPNPDDYAFLERPGS
jgi:4-hydroxyacetophenone monooxygenase